MKSFSPRNLLYMCQFYRMYPNAELAPQIDARLNFIFMIPWGHHKVILDKCKEKEKALFFVLNSQKI